LAVAIAAAASVALMTANGVKFSEKTLRGDIWIAINAIFYAIYLVRVKKLTAHYKPITINRYTFTFGLLFITPFGLGEFIQTNWTAIPLNMVMKIGYILVFTSFLVYLLNAYAIQHSGPTLAGLYIYLQPILASIIAVFLQTDTLTPNKVLYIALVLVSTFAASRFTPKFQSNLDGKSSSK
jgi:drug/metabolite transporter (DMT)-like permease